MDSIFLAASEGRFDDVKKFLNEGVEPFSDVIDKNSFLLAIFNKKREIVQYYLENIPGCEKYFTQALFLSIEDIEIVKMLINHGADIFECLPYDELPVWYTAIFENNVELFDFFVEKCNLNLEMHFEKIVEESVGFLAIDVLYYILERGYNFKNQEDFLFKSIISNDSVELLHFFIDAGLFNELYQVKIYNECKNNFGFLGLNKYLSENWKNLENLNFIIKFASAPPIDLVEVEQIV